MDKLKLIYKLSPIPLFIIVCFVSYFAYNCWQDEITAKTEAKRINTEFTQYKADNKAVKQIESNVIEAIKNGQAKTDALRNDIDNNLVELRVQVETVEQHNATASNTANQALRLARTSQQDYYNLRNAISYNKAMIEGRQGYYCTIIAPKNGSEFMCDDVN